MVYFGYEFDVRDPRTLELNKNTLYFKSQAACAPLYFCIVVQLSMIHDPVQVHSGPALGVLG